MKTKLFAIALVFISIKTFGQITVADTDIANIGDIIYQATDTAPGLIIAPGSSGTNQIWDFSSLQITEIDTIEFISPSVTPYASLHPNANLCINDDQYIYFEKSSNGIIIVGVDALSISIMVLPLPLIYGTTLPVGPNTVMDSTLFNMLLPDSLAFLISSFQAHTVDSIGIEMVVSADFNVDAWGEVTIPLGTFPALRLKVEEITTTNFSAYCTDTIFGIGSGWYPMPQMLFPSEVETIMSYQWWTNNPNIKFALVEMEVDSVGSIEDVVFLTIPQASAISDVPLNTLKVYPIPTTYKLNIKTSFSTQANYQMYDVGGKLILEDKFMQSKILDLSNFKKGSYLLKISTDESSISKKIIVQ